MQNFDEFYDVNFSDIFPRVEVKLQFAIQTKGKPDVIMATQQSGINGK